MPAKKKSTKKAAKTAKKATKKVARKAAKKVTKKTARKVAKKTTAKAARPAPSIEELEVAAFYIYLRRCEQGIPGTSEDDWAAAVAQFAA
ncbi:hypothetical protein [Haloferula sp. A504]|uniref:hypothetical protein n=1 Tax=Haloferula sp. A504 TaxID=3373601 RepID=UPI0031C178FA|nr:hypothetical protein [Verrucomicrobiaceae bacterium E54]